MRVLSEDERRRFFRDHLGVSGAQPIRERRYLSLIDFSLDGRPIGTTAEYRSRVLPPRRWTPAATEAWIRALER